MPAATAAANSCRPVASSSHVRASVSTTFGHTWEFTQGREDAVTLTIPPVSAGVVFRGAPVAKVTGRMVINFGKRRQGHFEWYAYPTLIVPAEDQPTLSRIETNTRPLTDTEKANCPAVPNGVTPPDEAREVVQAGVDTPPQTKGTLNPSEQHAND